MVHFVFKFRVQAIIYAITLVASNAKGQARAEQEKVIGDFLQKFIKPFLRSAGVNNVSIVTNSSDFEEKNHKILKLIKFKVKGLKELVQDEDDDKIETEDNLTLHGNAETTLIEFLPKIRSKDGLNEAIILKPLKQDPLKTSINKYKVLREQIKTMLDDEKVTEGTKSLILNTLDEIIAKLIESQCTWKPDRKVMLLRNDTDKSISKLRSLTKKQWNKLRHQYMDYLTTIKEKENAFMNQFHEFFATVINDTNNLSHRYRVRCELVQIKNENKGHTKSVLRHDKVVRKSKCDNFKLCSKELREFFIDFYNYVNDTAVSVFKNYASMYVRDVNLDFGVDNKVIVAVLNSLGDAAERKVIKIYKNELQTFTLDPEKKTNANVKNIKDFIKSVVTMTKTLLKTHLVTELEAMKTKLFMIIKEDLSVNLEVDMDNLERHYIDIICTSFVLCNGRYLSRKSGEPWTFRPRSNSEVFVKVQLSLDDEMKDLVAQSGLLSYFQKPNHVKYRLNRYHRRTNNFLSVSVTRTSIYALNVTEAKELSSIANNSTTDSQMLNLTTTTSNIEIKSKE